MKNPCFKIIAVIVIALLSFQVSNAQWQNIPNAPGRFMRTHQFVHSVVVGNYGTGATACPGLVPLSAFHIDTKCLPNPSLNFTPGEVFRTDCPDGESPYWRMLRDGNEKGAFFNLFTDDNFNIQASAANMKLFTPDPALDPAERIHINDGSSTAFLEVHHGIIADGQAIDTKKMIRSK